MPSERDREWQQHMSAVVDVAVTSWVYCLCSSSLRVWLPLTAPMVDKSGNIKENRRAVELRHQCFFSSSPHLPPPSPIFKQHLLLLLLFPVSCIAVSELSEGGSDITRSLVAHHVNGSLSCVRLPQGKLWSGPCLCTSRLLAKKERKKYLTECFPILLTDSIVCLSPPLRYVEGFQIGKGKNWQVEVGWIIEFGQGVGTAVLHWVGFQRASKVCWWNKHQWLSV